MTFSFRRPLALGFLSFSVSAPPARPRRSRPHRPRRTSRSGRPAHGGAHEGPRVPQHRTRDHGRTHRRLRGRRVEPVDFLRRHRLGRHPEDDEQRDHVRAGLRRPARVHRSATSRSHRPTRRSSMRGRASPTTASRPPGATASTRRSTAARPGSTWASPRRTTSAGCSCTRATRRWSTSRRSGACGARARNAGSTSRRTAAAPGPTPSSSTQDTGFVDVAMDPQSPDTLYAASYQRRRTPFGYNGGGPGSGLWKTTDGGATWTKLTKGLPEGEVGRIGLAVYLRDPNDRLRALRARQGGRHLPLGGPGRELDQDVGDQPAPVLLQQAAHRPEQRPAHLGAGRADVHLGGRRQDLQDRRGRQDPRRLPRDVDQPGETPTT